MNPIRTTKSTRLRRLEMYREDLDELVALFRDNCKLVTVSDDKFQYDSLGEMQKRTGNKVKHLDIRGVEPAVHFTLNREEATQTGFPPTQGKTTFNEIRTEEIDDKADALYYRIRDFLETKQRPNYSRPGLLFVSILAFAFSIVWFVAANAIGAPGFSRTQGGIDASLFVLSFVLFFFSASLNNLIYLTTRAESPSFWQRNQDDILSKGIVALSSTLMGAILGFIIGRLSKH
jgi:hypothetical protein